MNDKVDLVELEVEQMSLVDLGDATVETKQIAPAFHSPDSHYGWGYPRRAP
jgi:hypothetical protein